MHTFPSTHSHAVFSTLNALYTEHVAGFRTSARTTNTLQQCAISTKRECKKNNHTHTHTHTVRPHICTAHSRWSHTKQICKQKNNTVLFCVCVFFLTRHTDETRHRAQSAKSRTTGSRFDAKLVNSTRLDFAKCKKAHTQRSSTSSMRWYPPVSPPVCVCVCWSVYVVCVCAYVGLGLSRVCGACTKHIQSAK